MIDNIILHFKEIFYNTTIKRRILLYFLIIVFVPTLVISYIIYNLSKEMITEKINTSVNSNLANIEQTFTQKFDTIDDLATSLYLNNEFVNVISEISFKSEYLNILNKYSYYNITDKFQIVNELEILNKILLSYNFSGTTKSLIVPSLYLLNRPEYDNFNYGKPIYYLGDIDNSNWYMKLPYRTSYYVAGLNTITINGKTVQTIRTAKRIYCLRNREIPYAGVLTLDIRKDDFTNLLSQYTISNGNKLLITDSQNKLLISNVPELSNNSSVNLPIIKKISEYEALSNSFISKVNNANMLVSYKKIPGLGWTIISLYPTKELYGELITFKNIMYMVLALTIFLGFYISLLLSNNISHPISELVESMKTVREGNLEIEIKYSRNDEFSYLIKQYKLMMNRINELIQNLNVSELRKKEAELKALQSQINPHFLYNTLDSINLHALKYNVPEISTMIASLSDFFRYSLSKGKAIITLKQEKQQVESYLQIQKIRFKDKLSYSIKIPIELYNYLTVKLILQPIVENSIIHGIQNGLGKGVIQIFASKIAEGMEISIKDNGCGTEIGVNKINELLTTASASNINSYGIRNVNERIKQFFGPKYGLYYKKNSTDGITAVLYIPLVKNMEEYNVKNSNS